MIEEASLSVSLSFQKRKMKAIEKKKNGRMLWLVGFKVSNMVVANFTYEKTEESFQARLGLTGLGKNME